MNILKYFFDDLWYYLVYKNVNRLRGSHKLQSTLKPGDIHSFDKLVLNSLFTSLVNYVECECATRNCQVSDDAAKRFGYKPRRFWQKQFRNVEAGLDYLKWEQSLVWTVDYVGKDSELVGQRMDVAIAADEIVHLYTWWTVTRPMRKSADDVSGYSSVVQMIADKHGGDSLSFLESRTGEEDELLMNACKLMTKIENDYYEEDTQMLKRLMDVRSNVW